MKRKRRTVCRLVLLIILLCGLLAADSGLRLVTTEYAISYDNLPAEFDGFRILQISDLHGAVFGKDNRRLLEHAASAAPDIIALTGDLADHRTDMNDIDTLLAGLTEIAPVYYVSGNHEWSENLLGGLSVLFEKYGVTYLRNEYVLLERGGGSVVLAGAEDPNGWRDMPRPDALAGEIRSLLPDSFVVLLGHRNDWIDKYPELPVELIFCGHAHGGIIRLPGLGGLLGTGYELFPKYVDGVYSSGSYHLVISRGLGSSVPIPRFLNNPELVAVTLKKS